MVYIFRYEMNIFAMCAGLIVYSYAYTDKMCTNPERLIPFENEAMLPEATMTTLKTEGLMACAKQCLLRRRCKSFNFDKGNGECQLNNQTVDSTKPVWEQFKHVDGIIFSESSTLPERLAGKCANHQCSLDTMCVAMNSSYECKALGCPGTPVENGFLQNGITGGESELGTEYEYGCNLGYAGAGHVTCLRDGVWTSGVCDLISNCRMVKECQPLSTDGEFWLPVSKFNNYKALIYCHGMDTNSPEEYISLPNTNQGTYPTLTNIGCRGEVGYLTHGCVGQGGDSWYTKIRVNIETMEVDINNKAFANFTNVELQYGTAKDCYTHHYDNELSACGTKGRFTVDLRSTGWKVKDDQKWDINGYKSIIEYVVFERNGTIIKIACGGRLGICKPENGLFLEPYPNDVPNYPEVTLKCF